MMPSEPDHSAVPLTMRVGHGYDLHRLEPRPPHGQGREFILAGVKFPNHPVGPVSHSDGDAAYHAVTDAILGALGPALGGGDIGELFPDTDPQHDGADSSIFLRESTRRMQQAGYGVGNIDITIICERPKISPHKSKMIANIAHALSCEPHRVNIKGKTHEQVDAIGEGRAVEVHAVVTLLLTMQ